MTVISVSLSDVMLGDLDTLRESLGFSGRSEVVRAGIRALVQDERQNRPGDGAQSAILLVVHAAEFDDQVAGIKHDYEDLIRTHLHNKLDSERCVELFMLDGDAARVRDISNGFRTNKRMDAVKLVLL